jgi:hypothetical protein
MLIATQPQMPNKATNSIVTDDAEEGAPGHIGDILVSSYVSARISIFARAAAGSRR